MKRISWCFCVIGFVALFATLFIENQAFALGAATGGGPGSAGEVNYDCYSARNCPRWILVPKKVYQEILNNRRWDGTYSGLDTCKNDEWVAIGGYIKKSVGLLYIRNITGGDIPLPYKRGHIYMGRASSSTSVEDKTEWVIENSLDGTYNIDYRKAPSRWWFGDIAGNYNGKSITYEQLMLEAMKQSGANEDNLAAFCMSSIAQPEKTLTAYAVTEAGDDLNSGKAIGSKKVNHGTSAFVNKTDISGFTFLGWRSDKANGAVISGDTYTVNSLTANTNVYAVYRGIGATSSLNINVKNESVSAYGEYAKTIYAKPGDKTNFKIDYNPAAQGAYSFKLKKIQIDSGGIKTSDGNTILGTVFNQNKGNLGNWSNAFAVSGAIAKSYNYGLGDASSKTESNNPRVISAEEVGKTLKAVASTNKNDSIKTTPKGVQVVANGGDIMGKVDTTALSSEASIMVPYSFRNSVEFIDNDDSEKIVYAGEQVSLENIVAKVSPHEYKNSPLGKYATIVPNATIQICGANGECVEKGIGSLNPSGLLDGSETPVSGLGITLNVPDVSAGNEFCVTAKIMPATSGEESPNMDGEGDKQWSEAKSMCYTVAKRPTLQVWGGNVYSNGNIKTNIADKRRLKDPEGNEVSGGHYIFGSWAELGVIANGSVTGFASGAGYGYNNDYVNLSNHSVGFNFCNVSTLSFANSGCSNKSTGGLGSNAIANKITNDQESIVDKLLQMIETADDNNNIRKISDLNDLGDLNSGTTLIDKDNDFAIDRNIIYGGNYNALEAMPKVVIHAKNITINCDVTRIDALLIADEDVKTCNSDDENEENKSQLRINGAIIAKRLIANRTYGAGTGANSGDPAEIINFDPSLYLWGMKSSDETSLNKSNNIDTVYIRELAPRY